MNQKGRKAKPAYRHRPCRDISCLDGRLDETLPARVSLPPPKALPRATFQYMYLQRLWSAMIKHREPEPNVEKSETLFVQKFGGLRSRLAFIYFFMYVLHDFGIPLNFHNAHLNCSNLHSVIRLAETSSMPNTYKSG